MDAFRIGARRGDHVEVRVALREDGSLDASFDVVAAGVAARASSSLRAGDLERFRDALRALDEGGASAADLGTEDRALRVRVSRAAGVYVAHCFAVPAHGGDGIVKVDVTMDAGQLAELVWAIEGVARDLGG